MPERVTNNSPMQSSSTDQPRPANRISQWFFATETPYGLAMVRILVPLALLWMAIPRWFHVRELYSTDGAPTPLWENFGYSFDWLILSPALATALFTLMVGLLITASLGWKSRLSLVGLAVLIPYFGMLDTLSTLNKYMVVVTHLFVILAMSECRAVWSIDAWLKRSEAGNPAPPQAEVWPKRLIQLMIGVIYLSSAITKIQTPEFLNGDQITYWSLSNQYFANPLGKWLTLYPATILIAGYLVLAWEALFIFLVWKGPTRLIMLSLGVLFHAMTYFTLGLFIFPLIFIGIYACFLTEAEVQFIGTRIGGLLRSITASVHFGRQTALPWKKVASGPVLGVVLIGMSLVAVATESQMDVYAQYDTSGPTQLQPLSTAAVTEILTNADSVSPQDKALSIDVGTFLVGGLVANPRSAFTAGETALVQCRLTKPHEDFWIEVFLYDRDQQVVGQKGDIAPREESKVTFHLTLDSSLPAGEYTVVAKVNNEVASYRTVTIKR